MVRGVGLGGTTVRVAVSSWGSLFAAAARFSGYDIVPEPYHGGCGPDKPSKVDETVPNGP